jgi:LPXTG-motif cell wall-anchored protein
MGLEDGESGRSPVSRVNQTFRYLLVATFGTLLIGKATAAGVPVGFVDKQIYSGFAAPGALAALPDGRVLVVQQNGVIKMIKDDVLLPANFYTVQNSDDFFETGCLGVTIDPDFMSNGYVYLYCTIKNGAQSNNRVLRITANGDVGGNEVTLLNLPTILPDPVTGERVYTHLGGAMRFGSDGKLYIAVGGHENSKIDPPQNSYSQRLDSPFGKLLRINPDGSFPADNPFYNTPGAYQGTYSLGLRNPYGMDYQAGTGRLYINDVGSGLAEEINQAQAGANYGWPRYEGTVNAAGHTNPVFAYGHEVDESGMSRCAVTGGTFYNPVTVQFPGEYVGKYLFTDYCTGSIYTLDPDNPTASTTFATGISGPISLAVAADGSLYYLARNTTGQDNVGLLGKIEFTNSQTPRIARQPRSQTIYVGDPVTFTVQVSDAANIQWRRNGADIPGATSAAYTLPATTTADSGAVFAAVTRNSFGDTVSVPATLTITTNRLPVATITNPPESRGFAPGDTFSYEGTASDAEDGALPPSAFTWQANFHHDTHAHPFFSAKKGATSGSVVIPPFEATTANTWIELLLSATDSAGQTQTVTRTIYPRHQLSSLRSTGTPANGLGPIETDTSNGGGSAKDGGQISMDSIPYPKGLGVHAPSDIRYNLGGICSGSLIADVGVDDSAGNNGSVVFQVLLDGQVAYDSGLLRGSDTRKPINVDVTGKRELRLVVTDGGDGNSSDIANWAGARLACPSLPEETLSVSGEGSSSGSGGGGGCSTGGTGRFDPTLLGLALSALGAIAWRRRRKAAISVK